MSSSDGLGNHRKNHESSSSNFFLPLTGEEQAARLDWKFEHYSYGSDEHTKPCAKSKISQCKLQGSGPTQWLSSDLPEKISTVLIDKEKKKISKGKVKQVLSKSRPITKKGNSTQLPQSYIKRNVNFDEKQTLKVDDEIEEKIDEFLSEEDMTDDRSCSRVNSHKFNKINYPVSSASERTKQVSTAIDMAKYGLWEELALQDTEKPNFSIPPIGAKVNFQLSKDGSQPPIMVPATINQYLRDYQREGIEFLYNHYINNTGAILGDDMGLGKTVQVIGFLSALLGKQGNKLDTLHAVPKFIRQLSKDFPASPPRRACKPFLIIGPTAVMYNWLDEINSWGYFTASKFHGAEKDGCLADLKKGKLEIIVTTFETFRDCVDILNQVEWEAVIVDEVHKIKGLKAQVTQSLRKINTPRRFGLTGTALQNSFTDLWSILDWAKPGVLGSLKKFEEDFVDVIEMGQRHDATKRELAQARKQKDKFAEIRKKMLLRRTKALIALQLPKKEDLVVLCKLTDLQISVYKAILSHPDMDLVLHSGDPCDCDSGRQRSSCCYKVDSNGTKVQALIFSYMHLMLKAANHIALLLPDDKMSEKQAALTRRVCEVAFKDHPQFIEQTQLAAFRTLSDPKFCGKMKILAGLLSVFASSHDKVLVFSYSTRLLDIIEQYVISQGHEYRRIDGKVNSLRRRDIVIEFNQNNSIFLCLISTKAGGLGLNMTAANRVIIFDPNWNPSHDLQAQDRAYRLGQTRNVQVFRLVSAGTIEENIYLRQIYKQQLDEVAVSTGNARRYFFGKQGDRANQGELFGIKNMFTLHTGESSLTLDILKRNENIEKSLAGYDITKYVPPVVENSSDVDDNSSDDDRMIEEDDDDESLMRNLFGSERSCQTAEKKNSAPQKSTNQGPARVFKSRGDDSNEEFSLIPKLHPRSNQPVKSSLVTSPVLLSSKVPEACGITRAKDMSVNDLTFSTYTMMDNLGQQYKSAVKKSGTYKRGAESGISWLFDDEEVDSKVRDHKNGATESSSKKNSFLEDHVNTCVKSHGLASISGNDLATSKPCSRLFKTCKDENISTQELGASASKFTSLQSVLNMDEVLQTVANEKVVGSSRAEDHMTHCAMEDVFENHINSQAPALQCEPYTQPDKREASKRKKKPKRKCKKKEKVTLEDHNTKHSIQAGCYRVLVGQTPATMQRQQWAELCKFKSLDDLDLARALLSLKVEERLNLLKEFYLQRHPELSETITKICTVKADQDVNTNRKRLLTSNKEQAAAEGDSSTASTTSKHEKSLTGKRTSKNFNPTTESHRKQRVVSSSGRSYSKTTRDRRKVSHTGIIFEQFDDMDPTTDNDEQFEACMGNTTTLRYVDTKSCQVKQIDEDMFSLMHDIGDETSRTDPTGTKINIKMSLDSQFKKHDLTDLPTKQKSHKVYKSASVKEQKHSLRNFACILDDIFESSHREPHSNPSEGGKYENKNNATNNNFFDKCDNLSTSKSAFTSRGHTYNFDKSDHLAIGAFFQSSTLKDENGDSFFQNHKSKNKKTESKPMNDCDRDQTETSPSPRKLVEEKASLDDLNNFNRTVPTYQDGSESLF